MPIFGRIISYISEGLGYAIIAIAVITFVAVQLDVMSIDIPMWQFMVERLFYIIFGIGNAKLMQWVRREWTEFNRRQDALMAAIEELEKEVELRKKGLTKN